MTLKILFAAAECAPFAKSGGLGDVIGALPPALRALGHDVRVVMPRYRFIDGAAHALRHRPEPLAVPTGVGQMWCGVEEARLPGSDVPVYFLDRADLFDRPGIYSRRGDGHDDGVLRFTFLSRGALALCRALKFTPDVAHGHDWHTALLPCFLRGPDADLGRAASVLTVHNAGYQGAFPHADLPVTGLSWNWLPALDWRGGLNLLKGGLVTATLLTAVSRRYAAEIQGEIGFGLDPMFRERGRDLFGVPNGADYRVWNPESDPHLPAGFSARDLSGKAVCKQRLQEAFDLAPRPDVPVIGIVSRLVAQKGFDLLAEVLPRIMDMDVQVALLGTGEPWAEQFFAAAREEWWGRFGSIIDYHDPLAHLVEAGADFFLMPSRYEPCGLNQLYSLRYGAVPIVHATGGLDDTVKNFNDETGEGTGFKFDAFTTAALFDAVLRAVWHYYHRPESVARMRARGMEENWSWERSALQYDALYKEAVRRATAAG
ncbi:MAG: glycogen synthase [Planctomycetes bacterium]|nr:glycogen synthase [Planctomycetota bacterium]